MKVIIAGGRRFRDLRLLSQTMKRLDLDPSLIISGGAKGADSLGEQWAATNGVAVRRFKAEWNKHGRAAGPVRNSLMAKLADVAVVFWDGESRGSADMIEQMRKLGKRVEVVRFNEEARC